MTWVAGAATVDIGVLVGDIQISYDHEGRRREESRFGVQKLHQVVPSIWVGFAGSIAIGFTMVSGLREVGRSMLRAGGPPEPGEFLNQWRESVERDYDDRFPDTLRAAGCHLLIVGASQRWVENSDGRRLFRLCRAFRVEFPFPGQRFLGVSEVPFNQFDAIGSGDGVVEYRDLLTEATANGRQGLMAFAPSPGQGFGDAWHVAGYLTSLGMGTVIHRHPEPGISTHLLSAVVTAEGTMFSNNAGADLFIENGRVHRVPPMPLLASSLAELQRLERRYARPRNSVAVG